jgi:dethiobiotin synthetase
VTGYVVTGTDTGIGKTVFAAGLTAHLGGAYWKPVQAGLEEGSDNDTVRQLSGLPAAHFFPESYRLTTPCSPHRAAELDGVSINPDHLVPPLCDVSLVIEGAGGVLVPITRQICYADIFARWALPVILVARTSLGTINHSLLSIEALRLRDVPIHGVAFIGDANEDSEATICEMGGVRRLGRLPTLSPLNTQTLGAAFSQAFARSFLREDLA